MASPTALIHHHAEGNVLVLGDDMRIFLAITRALGRSGLKVHAGPLNSQAPALSSRYIHKIHRLPPYENGADAWVGALRRIITDESIELVIPCSDPFIMMLHQHRNDFSGSVLAIPNPLAIENLFDKNHTHILCERLSIPVSPARKLTTSDSPSTLLADFALPMVLKPTRSYSIDRPGQWGRVYIVETESTLRSALAEIDEPDRYMVETYFEGTGCGISVLANKGEIQQAFQHRRLREGLGAASSYRVSELLDPHMLEACVKIIQEMKHTGVCMFEFRVNDKTGAWILLETNARFWGSMPLPLALGVNFPVMLRDLLVEGKQWPPAAYAPGIRSRNITLDGFNLLKSIPRLKPKTVLPWLSGLADFSMQPARWLAGAEFNDSFAADDLKPGWQEILAILSGRR